MVCALLCRERNFIPRLYTTAGERRTNVCVCDATPSQKISFSSRLLRW